MSGRLPGQARFRAILPEIPAPSATKKQHFLPPFPGRQQNGKIVEKNSIRSLPGRPISRAPPLGRLVAAMAGADFSFK